MSNLVRIVHPLVGWSMVPEQSVGHWARSGWRRADEADEQPEQGERLDQGGELPPAGGVVSDDSGEEEPVTEPKQETPKRRRGASKEGD